MPDHQARRRLQAIGPSELRDLMARVHDAFAACRDEIDALNVFPVPDGDTGTNLLLTARSVLDEINGVDENGLTAAVVRGALMGARGNSGVIFSQLLRGLAEALDQRGRLDPEGLAMGLHSARRYAYDAVLEPVEGTMLTAIAAASAAADDRAPDLGELTRQVRNRVHEAVEHTVEQLEPLREAGVVDAGARGFEVFCEALHRLVTGEPGRRDRDLPAPLIQRRPDPVAKREGGSPEFRFEVQYLLEADEQFAADLKTRLDAIGDCVAVVGAGELMNVHVHTNDVGAAIEAGLGFGRPSGIQVTDFADQIGTKARSEPVGCVAVLPEGGLRRLAERRGVVVVAGAAGSLPSVGELLHAVGQVGGEAVLLLPGHPNVVPTARQAGEVSRSQGRPLHVVDAATSPPAALAALAAWDPAGDAAQLTHSMAEAAARCTSGEIVPAVRAAATPVGDVRAGQLLAVVEGEVIAAADDPVEALARLARACGAGRANSVTLFVGAEVDDREETRAVATVAAVAQGAPLDVIHGGQRPARYLLGVE